MKRFLKKIRDYTIGFLIKVCSKSRFLSDVYYLIFSKAFSREHQSVLAGQASYLKDLDSDQSSYYMLVRNIHRIEKGLLMKPRRNVFAKQYIEETIDSFENVWINSKNKDDQNRQLKWFVDVFTMYFEACKGDSYINSLQIRFESILKKDQGLVEPEKNLFAPYTRNLTEKNVAFEDFFSLTRRRRSVRWFLDKKVPRDLVDKAIYAAVQSPSACNRQPFTYRIIDDEELLEEVVQLPMGTTGYAHNIPMMVISIGNLNAYFSERDRHLIYIDASLANMTFMYALETLGLSSCPINWPDIEFREKGMENLLELKKYQRPIMCMGIGYPDPNGKVAYSQKKELKSIRTYN